MLPRFVLCVLGIIPMYACRKELTGNIVTPSDELLGYQRVPAVSSSITEVFELHGLTTFRRRWPKNTTKMALSRATPS